MEVGGPGDIVLDGGPSSSPMERGTAAPSHFSAHFALARSPISAAADCFSFNLCLSCKVNPVDSYSA